MTMGETLVNLRMTMKKETFQTQVLYPQMDLNKG